MIISDEEYLAHYGILRRSGRYPWGSGGPEIASNRGFLGMVESMKKQGMSDVEICRGLGITTTELRAAKSIARNESKQADIAMAQRLREKGLSNIAIGEKMNINESSVRALLAPGVKDKLQVLNATTDMLKAEVKAKGFIDVGAGVERHLDISDNKLSTAVAKLKEEGYGIHYIKVEQLGTGQQTTIPVLAGPGVTYSQVFKARHDIKQVGTFSEDGGRSFDDIQPPLSIKSKRVKVIYAEDGGAAADGVIYVRPGVKDVSLGGARYAQVRVAIDGTHYLKGMAMYKEGLPDGVDLAFNTNKSSTGNKLDAMKAVKDDPENPFGATVRQIKDPKTKKVTSSMNIVNEEGTWETWSRSLSSQFLSKQSPSLAKSQLDMMFDRKKREFDEIMALTNPEIKKRLLEALAEDVDSSAVHLKAHQLPKQANHVILPVSSLKENEIYAPNYQNGERVVLIRHPHGGIFEIPELTVNNRNAEAKKLLGTNAPDAVGINHKTAQKLSGADFDGDTVLVISNNSKKIKTAPSLKDLADFDPVRRYPGYEGMHKMTAKQKPFEMGDVSNLITDMTIKGANQAELARAVRHSMVVIDAEKHGLNYKQSALDNGIPQLKAKYQGSTKAGASTLISRASSRKDVAERKQGFRTDPVTGAKVFTPTGRSFVNDKGRLVINTQRSTKLAETDNAHTLSSGTPIEKIYADHSNRLKDLANQTRKASAQTKSVNYSPSAKAVYSKEVAALDHKLNIALKNAPLERQAQIIANANVSQKRASNPDLDPAEVKKLKSQELMKARNRTGARKQRIEITDNEWAAIQAGAISSHKLNQILANADLEAVKKLATPKADILMTNAKQSRALAMIKTGYTQAEVAAALGVSLTTLKRSLGGE